MHTKPHPDCDDSCLYHCTEAGQHPPTCMKKGIIKKYIVTKANGTTPDPMAEYFVLRVDMHNMDGETEHAHRNACRAAARRYAHEIEPWLPELAREIREKYPMPASAVGQPIAPEKQHDGHR